MNYLEQIMKYISTRSKESSYNSMEVIKMGISPDGGLFVPEEIPKLTQNEITELRKTDYTGRAEIILSKYLTDCTTDEIENFADMAYKHGRFDDGNIVPLKKLDENTFSLELWHGPTHAFKDVALQILPRFLTAAIKKSYENADIVILAATSGDTGKAALEGFMDVDGTHIIVFYPENGVSPMQKLQMVTQEGSNTDVIAVDGNFDHTQTGVKAIFTNDKIKDKLSESGYSFSSANSINWGRLLPQIVYHISSWIDLLNTDAINEGECFNVVIPTGNFGNILASWYAKSMGVPIGKFICASNKNNILTDFIDTGIYDIGREFHRTISPSMDILISSNLERLLFEVCGRDDKIITKWMTALKSNGSYKIEKKHHDVLIDAFYGGYADDESTITAIKQIYDRYDYVIDPHTAVGFKVLEDYRIDTDDYTTAIVSSTASPFKFPADVIKAIKGCEENDINTLLDQVAILMDCSIPDNLKQLHKNTQLHYKTCIPDDMSEMVLEILNIK